MIYVRNKDGVFVEKRSPRKLCTACGQLILNKAQRTSSRTLSDEELIQGIEDLVQLHFGKQINKLFTSKTHRDVKTRDLLLYLALEETDYGRHELAAKYGIPVHIVDAAYSKTDKLIINDGAFKAYAQPILDWLKSV